MPKEFDGEEEFRKLEEAHRKALGLPPVPSEKEREEAEKKAKEAVSK